MTPLIKSPPGPKTKYVCKKYCKKIEIKYAIKKATVIGWYGMDTVFKISSFNK